MTTSQEEEFKSEMSSYIELSKKSLDAAISWIANQFDPEDIFSEKQLEFWAISNGYIKE